MKVLVIGATGGQNRDVAGGQNRDVAHIAPRSASLRRPGRSAASQSVGGSMGPSAVKAGVRPSVARSR